MWCNYGYPIRSEPEEMADKNAVFGENTYSAIFGRPKIECKPLDGPMNDGSLPAGLRHLKVELKSLIVAKQACTAQQAEEAYFTMFGYRPYYQDFGYANIEDFLLSFPDICRTYADPTGRKIFAPVIDQRHKELSFQLSRATGSVNCTISKRENRLPCSNGPTRTSPPPSKQYIPPRSDLRYRQPWLKDTVASTKSIGQFPVPCVPVSERLTFKDDGAKCPARCRVIADMVRQIGQKSPDGTEIRCNIEALKNHYYHRTGLSLWGKIMQIRDYATAFHRAHLYEFWRIMSEPSKVEEGELIYFMVVPTDPKNNYFFLLDKQTMPEVQEMHSTSEQPFDTPVRDPSNTPDYLASNRHHFTSRAPPVDPLASERECNSSSGSSNNFEIYYDGEKTTYMIPRLF